ncbi:MAG: HDOD domain-containing protein [Myxococcota bacterium]|jgi:HD-like signal output (HDOD) protein|nr:HDOD domain-containing protein [Myxococcota bacterium]
MNAQQIADAIAKAKDLPSFPEVVLRLETEMSRPEPSFHTVAKLVQEDPALSALFLRVANSAFYSRGKAITDITQSVLRLGLAETRRLCLATAIVSRFSEPTSPNLDKLWVHSMAVALATQALASIARTPPSIAAREAGFAAGLLHDIGILALEKLLPGEYQTVTAPALCTFRSTEEAERKAWGIAHPEIGEMLARKWTLPEGLCQVIAFHKHPLEAAPEHQELTLLVHLANFVCVRGGYGRAESDVTEEVEGHAFDRFGLDVKEMSVIIEKVQEEGKRSEAFVEMF